MDLGRFTFCSGYRVRSCEPIDMRAYKDYMLLVVCCDLVQKLLAPSSAPKAAEPPPAPEWSMIPSRESKMIQIRSGKTKLRKPVETNSWDAWSSDLPFTTGPLSSSCCQTTAKVETVWNEQIPCAAAVGGLVSLVY